MVNQDLGQEEMTAIREGENEAFAKLLHMRPDIEEYLIAMRGIIRGAFLLGVKWGLKNPLDQ